MKFIITKENVGERLDKFLQLKLSSCSRSKIQKEIKAGKILVDDKKVSPHYFLKENQEINVIENIQEIEESIGEKIEIPEVEIIEDNKEYLIINKPSGLAVHAQADFKGATLIDWLLKYYPELRKIGEDPSRPGIVHRLDKEVSGLMVISKTQSSFDNLKKQFKERTVDKEYVALVYGAIKESEGLVDFPIERSKSGKMAALPKTIKGEKTTLGRRAITEFEVIKRFINFTLLKVKIKTGRTHQIRVHLLALNHPLAGDNLYGNSMTKLKNKKLNLGRVFLAAIRLGFIDLSGNKKEYSIELPGELKVFLEKIK